MKGVTTPSGGRPPSVAPASPGRNGSATPASRTRSAVSNGARLHVVPVGDGAWSRRFRDVLGEIVSDMGGPDSLSEGQRQLARRATTLAIACEGLEGEAAAGHAIDLDTYGQLVDRLGRCFQRLGFKRQPKPTLTLDQYLRSLQQQERAPDEPQPEAAE